MAASGDLSCFNEGTENKSKFEELGYTLQKSLRSENNDRIHSYQLGAVLAVRSALEEDFNQTVLSGHSELGDDISQTVQSRNQRENSPVLIVAPTGSGKSGMIVLLPYFLLSKKVLVLTPSAVISDQIATDFGHYRPKKLCFFELTKICTAKKGLDRYLENVSLIKNSTTILNGENLNNVVIVNAQKFGGRSGTSLSLEYQNEDVIADVKQFFQQFDTLIVDEAHHYPAETWRKIVDQFKVGNERKVIFLTATPYNRDGQTKILPEQRVVYTIPRDAVEGKTIRKCDFTGEKEDTESLYTDIQQILIANGVQEDRIDHQAMILVRTKDEANARVNELNGAACSDSFAVAIFDVKNSEQEIKDFNEGNYKVAIVCGSLREGYDNSNISLCVILRNVGSKILFDQFIGRCLRMKRFPAEEPKDRTSATVLSYKQFKQRDMWDEREKLAKIDPVDDPEED